ncbi:MAG: hypothetical protein NDJ89_10815 [Oligoflexia bacterium]|nr:hypothetical protein [Oligoflexia bacterium]
MSPKAAKQNEKKPAKAAKAESPKAEKGKKAAKGAQAAEAPAPAAEEGAPVDPDELEEQEDRAAASSGGDSNEAALAAAGSSTEMSASFKNFRHHPDMENFYRFIYENDLRHEALAIMDTMMLDKRNRRQVKGGKSAH